MDIKTYIESGILELYVAGSLSEKENQEVYKMMRKHPEILQEVLSIEAAIIKLTAAASGYTNSNGFQNIKNAIGFNADDKKVIPITKSKFNWVTYSGWAASIILAAGLFYTTRQNTAIQENIKITETQQSLLET